MKGPKLKTDVWESHERTKESYKENMKMALNMNIIGILIYFFIGPWTTIGIFIIASVMPILILSSYRKYRKEQEKEGN